jgi:hypothetical protein
MGAIDTGITTYTATKTDIVDDKTGALFQTSMGANIPGGPFGIHVWRTPKGGKKQEIVFYPGDHGGLAILWGKLYFVHNDAESKKVFLEEIPGYVPKDSDTASGTINLNESQLAVIRAQIDTVSKRAESAYAIANTAVARVAQLEKRVAALEAKPVAPGGGGLTKPQIEDIVWTKIWDVLYILRGGMNAGSSTDPNIQGWISDLTSFIKKVK